MARPKTGKGPGILLEGRIYDIESGPKYCGFIQGKLNLGLSKSDILRLAVAVWYRQEAGDRNQAEMPPIDETRPVMQSQKTSDVPVNKPSEKNATPKQAPTPKLKPISTQEPELNEEEMALLIQALDNKFLGE